MSLFSELSQIKRILPSFTNYRIVSEECAGKKSHSHQLLNDHHQTGQSLFAQLQKQQPAEDDGSDNHHLINSKDPEVKNGFLRAAFRKGSYSSFKEKKCCSRSKLHLCAGRCVRRHQILGTVLQLCSRTN